MTDSTIETYNKFSKEYADKFAGVGSRIEEIERAFSVCKKNNPKVLEIGCGDGRDAVEISRFTNQYRGFDVSSGMIRLAKEKLPSQDFFVADMTTYVFSETADIIFAFASLLHVNKDDFASLLSRAYESLSEGGLFSLIVKEGKYAGADNKKDEYGNRVFYYYEEGNIREMSKDYEILWVGREEVGNNRWLNMLLRRK